MPVSGSGGRGGSACAGAGATCACFFQLEGDRAEFIVAPPPAHMHTTGKEGGIYSEESVECNNRCIASVDPTSGFSGLEGIHIILP